MEEKLKLKIIEVNGNNYYHHLTDDITNRINHNSYLLKNVTADKPDKMFYIFKKYLINYVLLLKTFLNNSPDFLKLYTCFKQNVQILYEHIENYIEKEEIILDMSYVLKKEFNFIEIIFKLYTDVNTNENKFYLEELFNMRENIQIPIEA